jgi:hypothetical protein
LLIILNALSSIFDVDITLEVCIFANNSKRLNSIFDVDITLEVCIFCRRYRFVRLAAALSADRGSLCVGIDCL